MGQPRLLTVVVILIHEIKNVKRRGKAKRKIRSLNTALCFNVYSNWHYVEVYWPLRQNTSTELNIE